ncbi:hypothetical protein OAN307_c39710 [Octadecabacter antarcticus 307]|uniref:Uncharacterized protein n=1 Tax=Octadecabacter antarcticus 307 TaxID=391626 RepID=M9R9S1_9RHOB|nr:hypothetical protein [Octadecabacter antarcticus]AGI69399.1 hypothetical protein OAN307_c39710 [Octadecabacter antarcticus 307]
MTYHSALLSLAHKSPLLPCHIAITLRLADAGDDLLVRHVRLLRDCVAVSQKRWGFVINAAAVLPAEMQLLCAFYDADHGVRSAIGLITKTFDRHVSGDSRSVWSDKSEVTALSPAAAPSRRSFVEAAPVRAGLVRNDCDWPYSSAHVDTVQSGDIGVAVF